MRKKISITLKYAQTLDGRIATAKGCSRWISGRKARVYSHKLRSRHDAILVGVGTIIKDDPLLTTRFVKGKNPLRIIVDSSLRTPLNARIVQDISSAPILIATTRKASSKKILQFKKRGVEVVFIKEDRDGRVDLKSLISFLSKKGIRRVLVEGGSKIITSFLKKKLSDRLMVIISPKIMGKGIESVGDLGIQSLDRCIKIKLEKVEKISRDLVYIGSFK